MQKLMKNWIFTLVVAILLTGLAVFMILDGCGVGDLFLAQRIIQEITAVVVAFYVVLVLCPMVPRYCGKMRLFALGEIALLLLIVVGIFFSGISAIKVIEKLQLCAVFGFAIWLRCAVETVNAYVMAVSEAEKKPTLWRVCLYILLGAFGVWQMAAPAIQNRYLIFPIAVLTLLIALVFGVATVQNRRALTARMKLEQELAAEGSADAAEVEEGAAEADGDIPQIAADQKKD